MTRPTTEQFHDFHNMIDDDFLTEIFNQTYQGKKYEDMLNNSPVYKWLTNNINYKGALESLRRRAIYKESIYKNIFEIRLAGSAASSYALYLTRIEHPESILVVNKSLISDTKKTINKLIHNIENGVFMQNYFETENLWELLNKFQHELDNEAPPHFPTSNKPLLPEKMLIENLYIMTSTAIGEYMPTVVEKLAKVIADIDHTQFNRYAKSYKEKIQTRLKFTCPNVFKEEVH